MPSEQASSGGPLAGVRVLEVGGIGPGPFAGMMLADFGAEVIRVDRPGHGAPLSAHQHLLRGRRSVAIDVKTDDGRELVRDLAARSDVLIEGFRPGVMERLGLGPSELLAANPALVYGRMTGWGQDGPRAAEAGHDINYIALSGSLHPIVSEADGPPVPPLNMLGDFGGGGMLLVAGVLAALVSSRATGKGQVVDASIVDGSALLAVMLHSMRAQGAWAGERGHNLFDGGAPFYRTYRTSDGGWMAVGALEPQFYAQLVDGLGVADAIANLPQRDPAAWPALHEMFAATFAQHPRAHWEKVFAHRDACVTPVLAPAEVLGDEHLTARETFVDRGQGEEPSPAPRFHATPAPLPESAGALGAHTWDVLAELGRSTDECERLRAAGVIAVSSPNTERP